MKKFLITFCLVIAAVVVIATPLIQPYSQYATTGVALSATTNYAIIGAYSANAGNPVITYLNATAASSSAQVQFYSCTNTESALSISNALNINIADTNGFILGQAAVIRHVSRDIYERVTLGTPTTTNIVLLTAPAYTVNVGDIIYAQITNGVIPLVTNAATGTFIMNLSGEGIYSGNKGMPLLLDMIGLAGTNGVIRAVNAKFTQ